MCKIIKNKRSLQHFHRKKLAEAEAQKKRANREFAPRNIMLSEVVTYAETDLRQLVKLLR